MFFYKKKSEKKTYDHQNQQPVLKTSICNGEQVVGFKDIHTGKFEEVSFIRNPNDLNEFLQMYDISPNDLKKEW